MKQKKVELAWVKNEACDPKHLGDLGAHASATLQLACVADVHLLLPQRVEARRWPRARTAMVKLNLRLRGGGGDGGVYPLTHAEQKVRPSAVSG